MFSYQRSNGNSVPNHGQTLGQNSGRTLGKPWANPSHLWANPSLIDFLNVGNKARGYLVNPTDLSLYNIKGENLLICWFRRPPTNPWPPSSLSPSQPWKPFLHNEHPSRILQKFSSPLQRYKHSLSLCECFQILQNPSSSPRKPCKAIATLRSATIGARRKPDMNSPGPPRYPIFVSFFMSELRDLIQDVMLSNLFKYPLFPSGA